MKVVVVGHVDHGKSSLVGRLVLETSKRSAAHELAHITDALSAEQETNSTMDVAHVRVRLPREIVLIDAPGHREFLKGAITGTARADAGILVVDSSHGIGEQTEFYGEMLSVLGVENVILVLSKCDLSTQTAMQELSDELAARILALGLSIADTVWASATTGEGVVQSMSRRPSLVQALQNLPRRSPHQTLRVEVQDIWNEDGVQKLVGVMRSGTLHVGQRILFTPHHRSTHVEAFYTWGPLPEHVDALETVVFSVSDDVTIHRGFVGTALDAAPSQSRLFTARVVALRPLPVGGTFEIRVGFQSVRGRVEAISDTSGIATITLRLDQDIAADVVAPFNRIELVEDSIVAAGHIVELLDSRAQALRWELAAVHREARESLLGQKAVCIWLTGLPSSGKSTIARAVERRLHREGRLTYLLEGDNTRHGLSRDLGFTPPDRTEHLRRIGELCRHFVDAGLVVIAAFVSPEPSMRDAVRQSLPEGRFLEIHVDATLETCEARDTKGLYARARAGELEMFTGVDAPYIAPKSPTLRLDTNKTSAAECADAVVEQFRKSQS